MTPVPPLSKAVPQAGPAGGSSSGMEMAPLEPSSLRTQEALSPRGSSSACLTRIDPD